MVYTLSSVTMQRAGGQEGVRNLAWTQICGEMVRADESHLEGWPRGRETPGASRPARWPLLPWLHSFSPWPHVALTKCGEQARFSAGKAPSALGMAFPAITRWFAQSFPFVPWELRSRAGRVSVTRPHACRADSGPGACAERSQGHLPKSSSSCGWGN